MKTIFEETDIEYAIFTHVIKGSFFISKGTNEFKEKSIIVFA
jgi:hypothetical protein